MKQINSTQFYWKLGLLVVLSFSCQSCVKEKIAVKNQRSTISTNGQPPPQNPSKSRPEPPHRREPVVARKSPPRVRREPAKRVVQVSPPAPREVATTKRTLPPLDEKMKGFDLLQKRRPKQAGVIFLKLFGQYPQSIDVNWGLATSAFTSEPSQFQRAVRHYSILLKLLEKKPRRGRFMMIRRTALEGLGVSYRALNRMKKSVEVLTQLIQSFAQYGYGYYHLACTYHQKGGRRKQVRRLLKKAFRLSENLRRMSRQDPCFANRPG